MSYSKVIQLGSVGSITISESAGNASVALSLNESVGGGDVKGFAKASVSVAVDVSAQELIDAGLALAEAKFPTAAAEIAGVKAIIDAAIAAV